MAILDPQKAALYAWEGAWKDWNESNQTMPEIRRIVRKACRMYRVKPPTVTAHTHKEWTTYFPSAARISFEADQRNTAIALHEAAHHILFAICEEEAGEESDGNFEDHGAEFLGIYLWLLGVFQVAPRVALIASAEAAGLRFIPLEAAEPSRFRQRVAKELA